MEAGSNEDNVGFRLLVRLRGKKGGAFGKQVRKRQRLVGGVIVAASKRACLTWRAIYFSRAVGVACVWGAEFRNS